MPANIIGIKKYKPDTEAKAFGFLATWCDKCARDKDFRQSGKDGCEILIKVMATPVDNQDYPVQWHYDVDGNPECSAFIGKEDKTNYRCDKTEDMFSE